MGPKTPDNKTRDDVVSAVVETAYCHLELDAPEINDGNIGCMF
ncbi:MAG: hypothetical protein WBB08_10860 [Halobacteriota archaeon]